MKSRKVIAFLMLLVMMVPILTGCGGGAATTAAPVKEPTKAPEATAAPVEAPAIAPEVTVAIGADPADLSPFTGMSLGRIAVLHTIYEYLVEADKMGTEAVPMLAKSIEKTGEKTYVVTLFDNIIDSADNQITAADAAWSYQQGIEAGKMRPLGNIESVKATGDYTVEFVFKTVLGVGDLDKALMECPIISQKSYEASADKFAAKPITSAAYALTEYVPGSSLTFEARPDYWQTDPSLRTLYSQTNVQKIIFQVVTEPAQHAIALETGTADVSASVTGDDIARFASNPDFTVYKFLDNLTQSINFNGSEGNPFTKKELRQAVAYAIDTPAMCEAVAPGACAASHTIGNSNFGSYQTKWDTASYYDYDLAKAKELFAAAGYKGGDLTVKLLAQNDPRSGLIAQVIQASLAELGITVEISQVEPSVFNELQYDPTAFDMVIGASAGGDYIISPWLLIYDQHRNNGTTSSFFKDDQLQSLLNTVVTIDGFTSENIDAFHQYQKEQLYSYGLLSFMNNVVSVKGITKIVRDTRGQIMPGACEYSADFGG